MQSGQNELAVLWAAWVDRFSGRRISAALSFALIPVIGATGWVTGGPAVGITAAAGVAACFIFLVAFAMAHEQVAGASPSSASAAPPDAAAAAIDEATPLTETTPASGHTARWAH